MKRMRYGENNIQMFALKFAACSACTQARATTPVIAEQLRAWLTAIVHNNLIIRTIKLSVKDKCLERRIYVV